MSLLAASSRADEVHLEGGRVIEGATKVEGDRLILTTESGKIALPLASVVKVEHTRPAIEQAREREAKLKRDDIAGLLALADYCRQHDLRAKEHELLQRVLRMAPDHEIARRRLGYVRVKDGWITGPEAARERDRIRAEQRRAELERKRDEVELERKRAELALAEARLERERAALSHQRTATREERRDDRPVYPSYFVAPHPYPPLSPPSGPPPFPINGVRAPNDGNPPINGVIMPTAPKPPSQSPAPDEQRRAPRQYRGAR